MLNRVGSWQVPLPLPLPLLLLLLLLQGVLLRHQLHQGLSSFHGAGASFRWCRSVWRHLLLPLVLLTLLSERRLLLLQKPSELLRHLALLPALPGLSTGLLLLRRLQQCPASLQAGNITSSITSSNATRAGKASGSGSSSSVLHQPSGLQLSSRTLARPPPAPLHHRHSYAIARSRQSSAQPSCHSPRLRACSLSAPPPAPAASPPS